MAKTSWRALCVREPIGVVVSKAGGICFLLAHFASPCSSLLCHALPHSGRWWVVSLYVGLGVADKFSRPRTRRRNIRDWSKSRAQQRNIGVKVRLKFDKNELDLRYPGTSPRITSPGMTLPGVTSLGMTPRGCFWGICCPVPDVLGHVPSWPPGKGSDEIGPRRSKSEWTQPVVPWDCPQGSFALVLSWRAAWRRSSSVEDFSWTAVWRRLSSG